MGARRIQHLPTELLYMVLGYLGVRCHGISQPEAPLAYVQDDEQQMPDQPSWYSLECQTLSTLCLVSKHMRHVVEPILYREFMPGYGGSWRSTLYTWEGRLTSFMRTIAERQDLAALVKQLYIHPYLLRPFEGNDLIGVESPEGRDDFSEHIEERGARGAALQAVANALKTEEGLQQLSVRDLVTALVAQLPNLNHCSLETGSSSAQEILLHCSLGLRCATGIPRLALGTLSITRSAFSTKRSPFFCLDQHLCALLDTCPYLETLTLHSFGGIWSQDTKIPSLAKLKTLYITRGGMTAMDLDALISCCDNLRSFVYEASNVPLSRLSRERNQKPDYSQVHFRAFHTAQFLHRHRATLESVHIDLRLRNEFSGDDKREPPLPFSFQDFHALRHLFLNFTALYDSPWDQSFANSEGIVRSLPPSIVSLYLASGGGPVDRSRTQEDLLCLAKVASQGKFPNLREVRCGGGDTSDDGSILSTTFAAAGVDFAYSSWPFLGHQSRQPVQVSYETLEDLGCHYCELPPGAAMMPLPDGEDADL
ncbi:uncharacterized protein KD926_004830 [Aspergillus affinis]|uniref:uncharacterized protein n=1 Tax=Aspergillus affinis TaxID=1070780 RepID=UPI0022FDB749|nr:uncharacterized protein KD926_004830 [Aspergillus affinis]KAI9035003.1 hypothetical protein KD926_004830 [Aspergillus affinis]